VGINALQPHSHEIPPDATPGRLIAFYLEPNWLWRCYGIEADVSLFNDPRIAINAGIRGKAIDLVNCSVPGDAKRNASIGVIEDLVGELVGSVLSQRRLADQAALGVRFIDPRVQKAIELMEKNVSRRICFNSVAAAVGLSRPHFFALFREQMDITPNVYWNMLRADEACQMLRHAEHKMYSLAVDLGFTTEGNFSRFFRYHVGVPPMIYRAAVNGNSDAQQAIAPSQPIRQVSQRIREIEDEIERLKIEITRLNALSLCAD
jgi:AraC-like DNA-binding protein